MKRIIALILVVILLISTALIVSSCKSDADKAREERVKQAQKEKKALDNMQNYLDELNKIDKRMKANGK